MLSLCQSHQKSRMFKTSPGCISATVMPLSPKSSARDLVTAFKAALDALYAYEPPEVLSSMEPICKAMPLTYQQPYRAGHHSLLATVLEEGSVRTPHVFSLLQQQKASVQDVFRHQICPSP